MPRNRDLPDTKQILLKLRSRDQDNLSWIEVISPSSYMLTRGREPLLMEDFISSTLIYLYTMPGI